MSTAKSKSNKPRSRKREAKQPPYELKALFPINVITRDWDHVSDLNDSLKQEIWRNRALDPDGLYRSNMSGTWHSNDSLLESLGDSGKTLKTMFAQAFSQWGKVHGLKDDGSTLRLAAWAMVYSDRGYATVHTHPNCHASAVYYVDDTTEEVETVMATGVPVRCGDIEFLNPNHREFQLPNVVLNRVSIIPYKTGRMIVFPSNLPHFVHPVKGEGERISVACNCTFLPPTKG